MNSLKVLICCLFFVAFQSAIAQQRYYYQKTQEILNGEEASFPDSERKTRCLIFQSNSCQWEGEYVDEWNFGQYTRKPIVYNYVRNENGTRIYEFRTSSWTRIISVTPNYSQVCENSYYPTTGNYLFKVYNRVNQ